MKNVTFKTALDQFKSQQLPSEATNRIKGGTDAVAIEGAQVHNYSQGACASASGSTNTDFGDVYVD